MNSSLVLTALLALCSAQVVAPSEQAGLIDFRNKEQSNGWSAVNDGVMGGRSVGKLSRSDDSGMSFFGTLSLKNNGGFTSIRSGRMNIEMTPEDGFRIRLKGDGRTYICNLYPKTRRMAFSYRASLPTVAGQWTEVVVPLNDFTPTSFGRRVQDKGPLSPDQIGGIGFMLSDKKPGAFKLEIEWVKVEQPSAEDK
ncbi:MAG: CIA30 family protein [Pirellulales bacterium]|nr:CIA30 family protein [Pirellulales bacterium]